MRNFGKKILIAGLIFFVGFAGYLILLRLRATHHLAEIAKGTAYHAYGISLEIPPSSPASRGLIRPYLTVNQPKLSLSAWGLPLSLSLDQARVEADLWRPDRLYLRVPEQKIPAIQGSLHELRFRLRKNNIFDEVRAESFVSAQDGKGKLRVLQPVLELGPLEGLLPDHLAFAIQRLEYSDGKEKPFMKALRWELNSRKKAEDRLWTVEFSSRGGGSEDETVKLAVHPAEFGMEGKVRDIPREEVKRFVGEMAVELQKLSMDTLPETLPSVDERMKQAVGLYYKAVNFLLRLDFRPEFTQYRWGGFKFQEQKEGITVQLESNRGKGNFKFLPDRFFGNSEWLLSRLEARWKDGELHLEKIRLGIDADYQQGYAKLMPGWLAYYRQLMEGGSSLAMFNMVQILLSAFAQYPDVARYELKAGRLTYATPKAQGTHRDVTLGVQIDSKGVTYYAKDRFLQKFPTEPLKNIEDATADLSFGLRLPWEKFLKLARGFTADPRSPVDPAKAFMGDLGGIESHSAVDLGSNWFGVNLDLLLLTDLGRLFSRIGLLPQMPPGEEKNKLTEQAALGALQDFLETGALNLKLKISRLSKFQGWMEKLKSGTSLGLALLAPYVVIDAQADTLSATLELKEGEILLNGKKNETIENFLKLPKPNSRLTNP